MSQFWLPCAWNVNIWQLLFFHSTKIRELRSYTVALLEQRCAIPWIVGSTILSRTRFKALSSYIHVVDPFSEDDNDRLKKL